MSAVTEKTACIGNLVIINGYGVILLGKPGNGKSTLSFELLKRGQAFVADDLVLLEAKDGLLVGSVKPEGFGLIHLRGTGFVNLQLLFDSSQLYHSHPVHFCYQITQNNRANAINELIQLTV